MAYNHLNPGSSLYATELERQRKFQLERIGSDMLRREKLVELTQERDKLQREQQQRFLEESLKARTIPNYQPNFAQNLDIAPLSREILRLR